MCVYGATYWNSVGVLLADALSFGLALLERVLVLKLGAHSGGWCVLRRKLCVGGGERAGPVGSVVGGVIGVVVW